MADGGHTERKLTPQARRALEEAAARRAAAEQRTSEAGGAPENGPEKGDGEKGGPSGPEPTRYGDWERNGIAVDF